MVQVVPPFVVPVTAASPEVPVPTASQIDADGQAIAEGVKGAG